MEACSNYSPGLHLTSVHQSLTSTTTAITPLLRRTSWDFRLLYKKRARFKRRSRSLVLVNSSFLPPPFDGSVSLDSLAPTVAGFTSGLVVYLSSRFLGKSIETGGGVRRDEDVAGEWVLFTSPTPFNRFVLLRCSLLSFDVGGEDGELLEGLNDRLVKEDRHFVRLDTGKIPAAERDGGDTDETALEYQRVCISTEDGGVVSLDWPATLELREERGLDTTVILIPGTPDGSMDEGVRSFVRDALRRGVFPVVMNPRGCGGSPLTTARLFTAADSDDISTAVRFITKARPWTTLMGVGWGYGANMLTKYLAEVGEKTPLIAAVCIDNPFDLEEITRTSPYHVTLDRQLTGGLVEILRSNKALFQGRAKGLDLGQALSSKSVRDFEKAISMVTYGFENIEEFYSKSGTRSVIGEVKIPVLFIQNDDVAPPFSIPRGAIAENLFTSLLLCSVSPSRVIGGGTAAVSWCHHLAIEWLNAVELGLLKGRHPLLKDIDVTVNPSKGLALLETRASKKDAKAKKLLELTKGKNINGHHVNPITATLKDSATTSSFSLRSGVDLEENVKTNNGSDEPEDSGVSGSDSVEVALVQDDKSGVEESERGQILQTAEVVMNMLDVTMPGTLRAEEKKKVLDAVDQGETIVKALQDAVPEDVRGKLTTAVTAILHSHGTKLKFEKLNLPNVTPAFKPKVQEPSKGLLSAGGQTDPHSPDQIKKSDDFANGSNNVPGGSDGSAGVGPELNPSEAPQKYDDSGQSQPVNSNQDDSKMVNDDSGFNRENEESLTKEKVSADDAGDKASEPGVKAGSSTQGKQSGVEDVIIEENKVDQEAVTTQPKWKEEISNRNEEKSLESANENKMALNSKEEEAGSSPESPSDSQPGKEENNNQKKETKNLEPVPDQTKPAVQEPSQPTFSVSQAFDALTGIDDSTQVAVNSVFGVLENMLSQLEEESKEDNEVSDEKKLKDENINSPSVVQTPKVREAKDERSSNMSSQGSHDPVSGLHESRESSNHEATNGLLNENHLVENKAVIGDYDEHLPNILSERHANLVEDSSHGEYFQEDLSDEQSAKQLDLDTTTALLFDYYPEEGQWKLLEQQPDNFEESVDNVAACGDTIGNVQVHPPGSISNEEKFIEPLYVILDNEQDLEQTEKRDAMDNTEENLHKVDEGCEELMHLVKVIVLDSLNVEVQRRTSSSGLRQIESQLGEEIEKLAGAVSFAVVDSEHAWNFKNKNNSNVPTEKIGKLHGQNIIRATTLAVQEARFLRRVLPVGVIVGSILAALRKYFDVSTIADDAKREIVAGKVHKYRKEVEQKSGLSNKVDQKSKFNGSKIRKGVISGLQNINNDRVMVGAVTAALGASAMLVQQQDPPRGGQNGGMMEKSLKVKGNQQRESEKLDQSNMVAGIAEKAMSIAGPVVPTKESGEVDQERLVAMLADLGQKGGILKLVGKFALLWGGIRGAMSLTDRLISFLHVAEWPLLKRVVGFIGMVLVLWSPTVLPLLPTLVQSWSTNNSSKIAELGSIVGLYVAVFILVVLWGKRVRKYKNPLVQYGLDFDSSPNKKIQEFFKGVGGGVVLVLLIQSVNAIIGAAVFSWPLHLPSSFDALKWLRGCGQLLMLIVRGFTAATCVVIVEELLFRSWLPEEIAIDLGQHESIIISGLAFSLFQRSLREVPGLWLLSLALAGARQRSQGSLTVAIGLRTGIIASSFVLQTGQMLAYNPSFPVWIAGTRPLQPFSGAVGVAFALAMALVLYPRQSPETKTQKPRCDEEADTQKSLLSLPRTSVCNEEKDSEMVELQEQER